MACTHQIIDEQGTVWSLESYRAHMRVERPLDNLARYLVEKLGFVLIEKPLGRAPQVSFWDDIVAPLSLVALLQWVHEQSYTRLIFFEGGVGVRPCLMPSIKHINRRISDLVEAATPRHTFEIGELDAHTSPFRRLWAVAEEIHVADIPDATKLSLLNKLFVGRFSISMRNQQNGDFNVIAVGSEIASYQFTHADRLTTFRDMYDTEYGRWIADGFKGLALDVPTRFQQVTAPVRMPNQQNPALYRYSRLIYAPNINGVQRLLTASIAC